MSAATASTSSDGHEKAALKAAVLQATQAAHGLPPANDISYHRTLSREFNSGIDSVSSQLQNLTNSLLHFVNSSAPQVEGDDLTEDGIFYSKIVEQVDSLLELADGFVDEHTNSQTRGHASAPESQPLPTLSTSTSTSTQPASTSKPIASSSKERLDSNLVYAKHLRKPQLAFDQSDRPTNARGQVFRLHRFPNAIEGVHPLREALQDVPTSLPPLLHSLATENPGQPKPFEDTPFLLVDSSSALDQLYTDLQGVAEMALDLEHHDYRTYAGLTCLIQLSIPGKDYVIDALQPAVRSKLYKLNKWTADATVVKVLHGAKSDVLWLQRDFGIVLVGLFDTFYASKLLGYSHHGLANLLDRFCGFAADKRYQLADWRIRPLPTEMLFYARADTHFLLFIFHSLLQAIQSSGHGLEGLEQVANESNQVASTFYAHPCHDASTGLGPYGWRGLVQKWNKHLLYHVPAMPHEYITPRKTSLEFHVFRALHDWRDRVARDTDEAPRYVLSHHLLFKLAEERPDSINKLRTILGPAIKGKEQLVGLMRREIEKWEDLPDEPASSDDTHMESQGVLGNGLVREDAPVQQPSHLWSETGTSSRLVASTSKLVSVPRDGAPLSIQTSALFGTPSSNTDSFERRHKASERLHVAKQKVTQAISSVLPVSSASMTTQAAAGTEDARPNFIPLNQRTSSSKPLGATQITPDSQQAAEPTPSSSKPEAEANQDDFNMSSDVIIVSERNTDKKKGKQKKRSHASSAAAESPESTSNASIKKKKRIEVAPHDYSQEPSILDAAPLSSNSRKKKSKEEKKGRDKDESGSSKRASKAFKAPPRDRLNVSGGGMSKTFK